MARRKEKKRNPRPKIDYPPVATRTWIPPDKRPKKKRKPKYVKPPGITQPLDISSLATVWHKYRVFEDRIILCGNYSETYKKYTLKTNGYQTPCNCMIGITFSKLIEMPKWTPSLLDHILDLGNQLYLDTVIKNPKNKGKTNLALCEINDTFLIADSKITMTMKGTKYTGKLFKDLNKTPYLQNVIKDFFNDKYRSGIINTQNKYIAFWSVGKIYYLFDPTDHTYKGHPWNDISGHGFSVIMRLSSTKALVDIIHENIDQRINSPFIITPCSILRLIKINTIPPNPADLKIRHCEDPEVSEFKIIPARRAPMTMKEAEEEAEEEEEEEEEVEVTDLQEIKFEEPAPEDEYAPEVLEAPKEVISSMIPVQRAKAESVSYFANIAPEKIGILRASTHQTDERFTNRRGGVQSVTNAMAALIMLRIHKSKHWFKKILDDVLVLGEALYKQSMDELPLNERLKVTNVAKVITYESREFTPDVDEFTAVGKMQSRKDDVLDLLPALQEVFLRNNACIITGPLIMAIWEEDGYYYMFDPNERDQNGLTIIKSLQVGSELLVLDYTPGVACVTWYKNLKDLVEIYVNNLEAKLRRDPFIISRVQIKDFYNVPEPWYNFQGVKHGKWILRATFNQNDRRFDRETRNTQCTAMAAVALACAQLRHVKGWSTDDLDETLLQGDYFYKSCVEQLKANGKFVDSKLLVDELKRGMMLEGKEIKFLIEDCIFNGLLDAKNINDAMNLKQALEEFFKDNETAIVTSRAISVAVWRTDGIYYYFDSHSRDENGISANFGTACLLRMKNIGDLANSIESNFGPGTNNIFNISMVFPKVWDVSPDGIIRPPLNNFKEINDFSAILRSLYSERSEKFKLNRGRQTIPMCLAAAAMTKIYPSSIWSRDIMDEILYVGDKLFTDTMVAREKAVGLSETDDIDEVYAENCIMEFYIGVNKFNLNYGEIVQGNFAYNFRSALMHYFNKKPVDENDLKQLLIASDVYTIAVWLDEGLFYLFDPKPRDNDGQIYGKEEWSLKIMEAEDEEGSDFEEYLIRVTEMEGSGDPALPAIMDKTNEHKKSVGSQATEQIEGDVPKKHSARYWRMQEEAGKAATMWFTNIENLINHIIENIPPTKREDIIFKMIPIDVGNKPDLRNIFDASGTAERPTNYAGDWYEFKEIDYGRWILRGTVDYSYTLFPHHNRTRQSIAIAYVAIGYAHHYALNKFKEATVNEILKYGDRLHSATRNVRYKDMKSSKTLKLSEQEIEAILNHEEYGIEDINRTFCIGKDETHLDIIPESLIGDTTAYQLENILDVQKALTAHFETHRFGILSAKKLSVAVWRGAAVYYMFDPHSCGPNGIQCINGKACLTRYLEISDLSDIFLKNLEKEGQNRFVIHTVAVRVVPCPKEFISEEPEPDDPKYVGYNKIMPGKTILTGTISQDDPKFARGVNAQCAAISVVALTMTLLHKASLWTKPMVDEIVINGDELYIASIDSLGYDYNPWEQAMTVRLINRDYKVGSLKANCQLRTMDQKGIIDIKHPKILNLRQGIERFFEENTHGVIETATLTVAIWEEGDTDPVLIYMYDPNPRGPAGMALVGGAACVLTFESAKMAADHFISNITDVSKRTEQYVISPVEIVVGDKKTKMKTKKDPCKAKSEPDVKNPSPTECEKKRLRKMAEEERKKKETAKLEKIGRHTFHELPNGDCILRGIRSQSSKYFTAESRGNQDIPNCLAAFVVNRLVTVMKWHHKHIDMILDVGDTLYKDSYITYQPKDIKLGFKNVLRKVFIKDVRVALRIYKPVMTNILTPFNLEMALMNYFQQENFCVLSVLNDYVALFFKQGCYYIFDPHDRDIDGNSCESGWACVLKFLSLPNLVNKFISNIMYQRPVNSEVSFTVTLVTIGSITKRSEDITAT